MLTQTLTLAALHLRTAPLGDMVWPALMLEQRLLSALPITVGLAVEWLALWLGGFGLSWKRALLIDVAMNAVSTAAGFVLLPLLGAGWELFPGMLIQSALHLGTFNPITWAATLLLAIAATTAVEAAVVRWGFRLRLDVRRFTVLFVANAASVATAFLSFRFWPPKF